MHHSDEQRKEVNHGDEVELIVVKHWKDSIYIAGFDPVVVKVRYEETGDVSVSGTIKNHCLYCGKAAVG